MIDKTNSFTIYVCPQCKGKLTRQDNSLSCTKCQRAYPILDGIPDFLIEKPETSSDRILRNIEWVDKAARFYESKLWYPFVLNFYGGRGVMTFERLVAYTWEKMQPVKGLVLAERCLSETGFEQFEPEVYGSLLLFTARKV